MKKAYYLITGQCRKVVQYKFEGMPDHTMKYENGNPILLLENIKNTMLNFQPTKYPYHTIKN